jgi:hypothetical protein
MTNCPLRLFASPEKRKVIGILEKQSHLMIHVPILEKNLTHPQPALLFKDSSEAAPQTGEI